MPPKEKIKQNRENIGSPLIFLIQELSTQASAYKGNVFLSHRAFLVTTTILLLILTPLKIRIHRLSKSLNPCNN